MKLSWTKSIIVSIVYNLFMYGQVQAGVNDDFFGETETSGVTVKVRPDDAEGQRTPERLRREAAEARAALAKLESANRTLRESELRSREELIELTKKFQEQNEQYRQLRLVLAGALASGKVRSAGEREEQLLRAMNDVADNGGALALKTVKFCELVSELTHELPIGKVKQAEIRLKSEDLVRDSRRFIALTTPSADGSALTKCRILAVNRELSVVILPVGTVHGAFNGLMYYTGKGTAVLKVVGVRPFVAAAQLVSGSIDDLAPGMEAVTQNK